MYFIAASPGLDLSKISFLAEIYRPNANVPENSGEVTQLIAILPTLPHETASTPLVINTKPIMDPTIVCVVETGHPLKLATYNQVPPAKSADNMPITNIFVSFTYNSGSTIP